MIQILEDIESRFAKFSTMAVKIGLYKLTLEQLFLEAKNNLLIKDLIDFPVSRNSKFSDSVWDWNEGKEAAKTLGDSRFKIDFSKCENVPIPIIFELKIALLYVLTLPAKDVSPRSRRSKNLSIQSITPMVAVWLKFMNHICGEIAYEFGNEFIRLEYHSLSCFRLSTYTRYSKDFTQSESTAIHIERVFAWFSAPRIQKAVFVTPPVLPKLSQLGIQQIRKIPSTKEKILEDEIFEKAVAISAFIVNDCCLKLGLPVADTFLSKFRFNFPFDLPEVVNYPLTAKELEEYTRTRIQRKNGSRMEMKVDGVKVNGMGDIYSYTKLVHDAAMYLIGQFTGARPSELVEFRADQPLVDSFGIPCIKGVIHKHRQKSQKLFDDLWVAIPAVQDALSVLSQLTRIRNNPYVFSKSETVPNGAKQKPLSGSIGYPIKMYFEKILSKNEFESIDFYPYMMRHSLAYQMFIAELGLPFISHQLKHFGNLTQHVARGDNRGFSLETLGYGAIGDMLSGQPERTKSLRHKAEVNAVKMLYDPSGNYAGVNAEAHRERLKKLFSGYQAEGYTKEEIYEAMAKQGIAIINVGMGMCYGGKVEDFDDSLPCIGSLRCNPNRCPQAVVTKAHAPKWREVYAENIRIVEQGEHAENYAQAKEAAAEAKGVLEYLGG